MGTQNDAVLEIDEDTTDGQVATAAEREAALERLRNERGDNFSPDDDADEGVAKPAAAATADADEPPADDDANAPEPEGRGKPPIMIPKSRLDEVIEQRETLAEQNRALALALSKLQGGTPAADPTAKAAADAVATPDAVDLDALEESYQQALLDGDTERAKSVRREIRAEEQRLARAEAEKVLEAREQESRQAQQQQLFSAEVARIRAEFPQLDHQSAAANKAAIDEVVEYRDFLVASKGIAPHTALRQAAERIAKANGWERQGESTDPAAKPDKDGRTASQLKANAVAANRQPPTLNVGVGNRTTSVSARDVEGMSEDEFERLPEAEKRRLRGDSI